MKNLYFDLLILISNFNLPIILMFTKQPSITDLTFNSAPFRTQGCSRNFETCCLSYCHII
ncbi:hypothetical protein BpHYR1_042531 [Brachionus plicatilis]|uniref:Uncharacterized protein n=1 Tax=Brachionus plicatilis TaxID=10195 RepID=A0A3M7PPQ1_BRAPC|nr:hypothetical protein BpHYR1_042531 [Brachionus plicatilis]